MLVVNVTSLLLFCVTFFPLFASRDIIVTDKVHFQSLYLLCHRLSNNECHDDAEGDFDLVSRGDCQSESYCDDDQRPIYQDSRASPRKWFLLSPQGELILFCFCHYTCEI